MRNINQGISNISGIDRLKEKIQEGFDSGRAKDFDRAKHLALIKASRASKI